jgi:hypothetical protein
MRIAARREKDYPKKADFLVDRAWEGFAKRARKGR